MSMANIQQQLLLEVTGAANKKQRRKLRFKNSWLLEYQGVIIPSEDERKVYCVACNTTVQCITDTIRKHVTAASHKQNLEIQVFAKRPDTKTDKKEAYLETRLTEFLENHFGVLGGECLLKPKSSQKVIKEKVRASSKTKSSAAASYLHFPSEKMSPKVVTTSGIHPKKLMPKHSATLKNTIKSRTKAFESSIETGIHSCDENSDGSEGSEKEIKDELFEDEMLASEQDNESDHGPSMVFAKRPDTITKTDKKEAYLETRLTEFLENHFGVLGGECLIKPKSSQKVIKEKVRASSQTKSSAASYLHFPSEKMSPKVVATGGIHPKKLMPKRSPRLKNTIKSLTKAIESSVETGIHSCDENSDCSEASEKEIKDELFEDEMLASEQDNESDHGPSMVLRQRMFSMERRRKEFGSGKGAAKRKHQNEDDATIAAKSWKKTSTKANNVMFENLSDDTDDNMWIGARMNDYQDEDISKNERLGFLSNPARSLYLRENKEAEPRSNTDSDKPTESMGKNHQGRSTSDSSNTSDISDPSNIRCKYDDRYLSMLKTMMSKVYDDGHKAGAIEVKSEKNKALILANKNLIEQLTKLKSKEEDQSKQILYLQQKLDEINSHNSQIVAGIRHGLETATVLQTYDDLMGGGGGSERACRKEATTSSGMDGSSLMLLSEIVASSSDNRVTSSSSNNNEKV